MQKCVIYVIHGIPKICDCLFMKEAQGRMCIWQSPVLLCLIVVLVIFSFCHFRIRYVIDSFDLIYVFFLLRIYCHTRR